LSSNLLRMTGISFSLAMVLKTTIAFFHVFGYDIQQGLELLLFLRHLHCFVPKEFENILKFWGDGHEFWNLGDGVNRDSRIDVVRYACWSRTLQNFASTLHVGSFVCHVCRLVRCDVKLLHSHVYGIDKGYGIDNVFVSMAVVKVPVGQNKPDECTVWRDELDDDWKVAGTCKTCTRTIQIVFGINCQTLVMRHGTNRNANKKN
jgi:hypothetical protein